MLLYSVQRKNKKTRRCWKISSKMKSIHPPPSDELNDERKRKWCKIKREKECAKTAGNGKQKKRWVIDDQ